MNTRLYPAPPTEEDLEVWCLVAYRFSFGDHVRWSALANVTREVAKRDADLMLYAQQHKLVTWVGPPMIAVRNAVSAYWSDPPWQGTLE